MVVDVPAVIALIWTTLFLFAAIPIVIQFWHRRTIQPIKARSPGLVHLSNIVFIIWMILLCLQRVFHAHYPCWVTMWEGYLGLIFVCNIYGMRSWILYCQFHLTQRKLDQAKNSLIAKLKNNPSDEVPDAKKSRKISQLDALADELENRRNVVDKIKKYLSFSFMARIATLIISSQLLAPAMINMFDEEVKTFRGDGCHRRVADTLLSIYASIYLVLFIYVAIKLRSVVDGFRIKDELRNVGITSIVAIGVWFTFNNSTLFKEINTKTFPISTTALWIAIAVAMYYSTVWPLYMTYVNEKSPLTIQNAATSKGAIPMGGIDVSIPVATAGASTNQTVKSANAKLGSSSTQVENRPNSCIREILESSVGLEHFRSFCSAEFSVENLLFWEAVQEFRNEQQELAYVLESKGITTKRTAIEKHIQAAMDIQHKFVDRDSPLEVNLPSLILSRLNTRLEELQMAHTQAGYGGIRRTPTAATPSTAKHSKTESAMVEEQSIVEILSGLYDEASVSVVELMERDTFHRFTHSQEYKLMLADMLHLTAEKDVLRALDVL